VLPIEGPLAASGHPPLDAATRCTCAESPFCSGPSGADWLSCDRGCRSCHPPKRRQRTPRPIIDSDPSSVASAEEW
jgi:hypothetical protein